jgi:hypothetical protein
MMTAVIFPDIEVALVRDITAALAEQDSELAQSVRVATIKPAADEKPYPSKIVVIRGDGGPQLDHVRKLERVGVTIWADTYQDASQLARLVEALVKQLTGTEIKLVDVILSPVRIDEAGPQECRYMTLEVITKGTPL